ncbi:phage/plasmid primase, P4 family [Eubacteriales bacterium OttesenSCG-928-N13]|nr:phage/plasmid primase, P4 family [Eubacteriales bacterium OttesenSCG-928-N13]
MLSINLYHADCIGNEWNCSYPHAINAGDEQSLRRAVCHDYVCVEYKGGYRSKENFVRTNCLALECDNDHSDKPEDWITPETLVKRFPDTTAGFHFSRNHMKEKRGKAPRPKFHCFFLIDEMTDPGAYRDLKKRMSSIFPYFDTKALDAARFFFGTSEPEVEFYPGSMTLNECLELYYPDTEDAFAELPLPDLGGTIPEGSRNATLSHYAGRVLKRLGNTEEAHKMFLEKAATCSPPLESGELSTIWHSAVGFYGRISARDDYIPPDQYGDFLYMPGDQSDVGEARMLEQVFSDQLRYSPATDFIVYDGAIWEESIPGAHNLMHDLSDMQLEEASTAVSAAYKILEGNGTADLLNAESKKKAQNDMSDAQMKTYLAYTKALAYQNTAMNYRQSKNIKAVLTEVQPMVLIRPQDLDADPYLLNAPDCAYDLRLGMNGAMPHSPDHFATKMTAVQPSDEGAGLWRDALHTFFLGDRELIQYVQLVAGMIAVGKVFIEALIIAYGDGRNGKSTFWNVLAHVLGTYSGNISADALTVGCKRNVKPELAEAKGKRMLIAAELEEGTRLNTSIIKQLCSTDDVAAEKKYKAPFSYTPSHTLVLYTNHLPKVGAKDAGIWRRLIVIPFNAKIEGNGDIKNYADYLFQHAGGAILTWIIEGAAEVIRRDFKIPLPECVQKAIKSYREDNDWLGHFLSERCETGDGLKAKSGELYAAYRAFCADHGEYTRSTTDFYNALESEGFAKQKLRSGNFIVGLRLGTQAEVEDDFLK